MIPARAAILAGGRASRMGGRNKALLEVDGRMILDRQVDALRPLFPPGALAAVLAAAGDAGAAADDPAPFAARGLTIVRDRESGHGPLAGIAAALGWAGGALLFALACDMPCVDTRVVEMIVSRAAASSADIALATVHGRLQPLFACYSARCGPLIERELAAGHRRASALSDAARAAGLVVDVIDGEEIRKLDPDLRCFTNFNSPTHSI